MHFSLFHQMAYSWSLLKPTELHSSKKIKNKNRSSFFTFAVALTPTLTMSGPKKIKVYSECWAFNKEWTAKYFFTEVRSKAVCLICQETPAVFKEYNISHYFSTKHANYASNQSMQEREATAQRLAANLQAQWNIFVRQTTIQEASTKLFAGIQISKG